jgi:hypothetical protein
MANFPAFLSASKPGTSPFCRLFQILSVPGITRGRLLPTTGVNQITGISPGNLVSRCFTMSTVRGGVHLQIDACVIMVYRAS